MSTADETTRAEIERLTKLTKVNKDLYTPHEIAELFSSISVDEVTHAVFSGKLPAVRNGESIVGIHRADFLRWMENNK